MVTQSRVSVQSLLTDRLKRAREQAGYTQAELAEMVGVAPITISRWESGIQRPCPRFRRKLCQELGKSASELCLDAVVPNSEELTTYGMPGVDTTSLAHALEHLAKVAGWSPMASDVQQAASVGRWFICVLMQEEPSTLPRIQQSTDLDVIG